MTAGPHYLSLPDTREIHRDPLKPVNPRGDSGQGQETQDKDRHCTELTVAAGPGNACILHEHGLGPILELPGKNNEHREAPDACLGDPNPKPLRA